MNPRGRLRLRRRAATETVDGRIRGPKSDRVQYSVFLAFFFAYLQCSAPSSYSNPPLQFFCDNNGQDFGPIEEPQVRFWTSKTALLPQVAQKSGSEASRSILLTSSLKSSSGASLVCTRSKLRLRRNDYGTPCM